MSLNIVKNKKALEAIQALYINNKTKIAANELQTLKVDTSLKRFQIGNLTLEKLFLSENYEISLTDKTKDLDAILISEHPKLLAKLQSLWFDKRKQITWDEMKDLKINTPLTTIKIGNFILNSNLGIFGKSYSVDLIDKKKDSEGKWTDKETNVDRVLFELKNFGTSKQRIMSEKTFEKELYSFLESKFQTVDAQVSIGGVKALKIDLDLGHGQVGVELKLGDKLIKSIEKQRFIGQMHDYTTKRYKPENFILVVVGDKRLRIDTTLKEVIALVESKSHFVFISLKDKDQK